MKIRIEEHGQRLRLLARQWGVERADAMAPDPLRREIAAAYRQQVREEERRAVAERHIARFGERVA